MSALRDDLRATADSIAADAARLADVEQAKLERSAADPALPALADEAEALSDSIGRKVAAEGVLVDKLQRGPRAVER